MVPVIIFSVMYGMFMANCYKLYGLSMGMDDKSLTIIGSIGSAFNGCSRAFWATLMDKIGYKKTYFFLIILNLLTTSTIGYV
jgi:OFA family oxalate/formate antiporter-like MFS transporter